MRLRWALWRTPAEAPHATTPVALDVEWSTHRYLADVPYVTVGSVWSW